MSAKQRIVFLDRGTLQAELRIPDFDHTWSEYPETAPEDLVPRLFWASIVITNKVVLDRATIEALPRLRLIAVAATGVNAVDLDAAREAGIAVANIRDYATHSVPEHVFMLLLALRRQLLGLRADLRAGKWHASRQFCLFSREIADLHGATLGIVGRGSIGQSVARLAEAFGMRVLFAERKDASETRPGYTDFMTVLREADALTLHCPLDDATRDLIGAPELDAMKRDALLINCARGGIVDEAALLAALKSGRLGGAGVDVLSEEPPAHGNPLLDADQPNLIVTPHVAWASRQAQQTLADQIMDVIEAFARGEAMNRVA
jgi:glycerate dehydrogenase